MFGILARKRCSKCRAVKSLSEFSKKSDRTSGYASECKECDNAGTQKSRQENKDLVLKSNATYRENNREKIRAWHRKNYAENRDELLAQKLEYQKNNKAVRDAKNENRRARRVDAEGSFTKKEWIDLCNKYGNKCLCCGEKKKLTADHVIPLEKGGTNYITNIQPLCGSCNSRKHTKAIDYRKDLR